MNAFGGQIALEGGHDVRSLFEANLDSRDGQTFLYNRYGSSSGNYWDAQNDRTTYFGASGLIGYSEEFETSRRRDNRILGFIQNVEQIKSKEISAIVGKDVTHYNHNDGTTTKTSKWVFGGSLKALLGIHGNLEFGINFNYNSGDYER